MPSGGDLTIFTDNALLDERYRDEHPEVIPGAYVLIGITDTGTGIPPEILEHIFEPFFTTKEVGKGSGLGLSMVYGFVKQSNGHIAVYSEPGLGTTVRLYLPAMQSPEGQIEQTEPTELPAPAGSGSVLVVEDDMFVRGYAVGMLESLGYRVITAAEGHEALAKLNRYGDEIDILFSDVVMPGGISGWELAERAQRLRPGLKVLLTSGYPLETLIDRVRPSSVLTILNKPYRKVDLAHRLRELQFQH